MSRPPIYAGTAYGFFNLLSGLAMLAASIVAGLFVGQVWRRLTFIAGMAFCVLALPGNHHQK